MDVKEYDERHRNLAETFARELMRRNETKDLTLVPELARKLATQTLGERPTEQPE